MKRFFTRAAAFVLSAALLMGTAAASGGAVYSRSLAVSDLTYTNAIRYGSAGRLETYALETVPGGKVRPIVMACDTIYGGMTLPTMVSYAEKQGYNVVGAINADYYYGNSIPIGLVIENGIYKSSPEWNNAAAFLPDGSAYISDSPTITIKLDNQGGAPLTPGEDGDLPESNAGKSVTLTHYNKTRDNGGGLYLLNEYFSTVSTRTSTPGWMVRLQVTEGEMTVDGEMTFTVTELMEGSAAQPIGEGNFILTADDSSGLRSEFEKFAVGDRVKLTVSCSDERLAQAEWATGTGDIILENGVPTDPESWTIATAGKAPRSALGIRADGSILLLAADGRQSGYSAGLTVTELAEMLKAEGCVSAVNLDGGGSTIMGVKTTGSATAAVVNSPSDGSARRCAGYILLVTDVASDGTARTLGLKNDGALVYAGSSLPLQFAASDSGLAPVAAPAGIAANSSLGSVKNGVYTAGDRAGQDVLTLTDGSATGKGNIFVVDALDSITVSAGGRAVTSLKPARGETVQLSATAKKWGESVAVDADEFTYTCTGAGSITPNGRFTAGASGSESIITVSAGGARATVTVKVKGYFPDCDGHWAEEHINALAESGVVGGVTADSFLPNGSIKRGDFMLMLYRAAGQPTVPAGNSFSDVPADKYYAAAIRWAASQGIALGNGDGTFAPEATLTREQGFAFLYRALDVLGTSYSDGSLTLLDAFSDAGNISAYAKQPTATLLHMGIVGGSGGALDPQGSLTRAQMAKILNTALRRSSYPPPPQGSASRLKSAALLHRFHKMPKTSFSFAGKLGNLPIDESDLNRYTLNS